MAERNPLVDAWIAKAEGDWDWTEVDMASRLRQALLLRLGPSPREDSP
jgi:hypothetical protein